MEERLGVKERVQKWIGENVSLEDPKERMEKRSQEIAELIEGLPEDEVREAAIESLNFLLETDLRKEAKKILKRLVEGPDESTTKQS